MAQSPAAGNNGSNNVGNFFQRMFTPSRTGSPNDMGNQDGSNNNNQQRGNNQNNPRFNNQGNQQGNNQGNNNNNQQSNANNQGASNDPETQQTPLDAYKGLWDNTPSNADQPPKFEVDGKIIDSTAASMDFMRDLPEDMQQAMEALGENSPHFAKLLNHVGRKAYASAISHNSLLTGKYLDIRGQHDQKGLGRTIKQHMALTGLDAHSAAQNSPIVKENLRMIGQNLARLNPDASPDWIQQKSIEFFTQMSEALNPKVQQAQLDADAKKAPGGQEFDWDTWINQPTGGQAQ